uniref:Uncharacterized protein n=1 Tax=Macrostomum lignano TaxID=282301 RepID=A0A1I8F5T8_9PLAT
MATASQYEIVENFEIDIQTQRAVLKSSRATVGAAAEASGSLRGRSGKRLRRPSAKDAHVDARNSPQDRRQPPFSRPLRAPPPPPTSTSFCCASGFVGTTMASRRCREMGDAARGDPACATQLRRETSLQILYEYLAEASVVFSKVFPSWMHSIIQNMLCTEEPSQQQQLSYLQSIGFGGLWRFSGQFTKANQNKGHAEHFVNLWEAMVETCLPFRRLRIRAQRRRHPTFPACWSLAASGGSGGCNCSSSLSSPSVGSLQTAAADSALNSDGPSVGRRRIFPDHVPERCNSSSRQSRRPLHHR